MKHLRITIVIASCMLHVSALIADTGQSASAGNTSRVSKRSLFDGNGPGTSTIGTAGDYASLRAACDAINSTPLTGGNWTFLILNDLTENSNSILSPAASGPDNIIIKPAPDTNPTVTFTTEIRNLELMPGHFLIGPKLNAGNTWQPRTVNNIIIDGSSDDAGTSRNLTFRNIDQPNADSLIHVYGDCNNITIKNCRFEHHPRFHTTEYGELRAVEIMPGVDSTADVVARHIPDFCTVANCEFLEHDDYAVPPIAFGYRWTTPGIIYNGPMAVTVPSRGMIIRDNLITAPYDGIHVAFCEDIEISGNTLRLVDGGVGIECDGPSTATIQTASYRIYGNDIRFKGDGTTDGRHVGIDLSVGGTTGTALVANNMISGISDWAVPHDTAIWRKGIQSFADPLTTVIIAHNSLNLHAVDNATTSLGQIVYGIDSNHRNGNDGKTIIRNNLIRVSTPDGVALAYSLDPGKPQPESDSNIIFAAAGSYIGRRTIGRPFTLYPTLPEWQTGTGFDLNSSALDPMAGAETWIGPVGSPQPDLHFTGFPGEAYLVPPMAEVSTDIDGEARSAVATMAGADEVPQPAGVWVWELY